jgi:hypothetical protein
MFSKLWSIVTTGAAIYMTYNRVQTVLAAKDQFYKDLPPELQTEWDQYFGKPGVVPTIANPGILPVAPATTVPSVTPQITQVAAGI